MTIYPWGSESRYYDYRTYVQKMFGERAQKVSVNAGFTCPNRDGNKGFGGCAFCNNSTFNPDYCDAQISVTHQIETGLNFFSKYKANRFFAYFQAYSNTYGETQHILNLYKEALSHPSISGIVIGTRPDCISDELLIALADISKTHYVAIELGAESCYDKTLDAINRGHSWQECVDTTYRIAQYNIPIGLHLIMGLPGETYEEQLSEASIISHLPITFLKLHQLQIVRGSAFADIYSHTPEHFSLWSADEYIEFCIDFAERLSPHIVIERFISQAPRDMVIAPSWDIKNFEFVHKIERRLKERNTWQGRLYKTTE